MSQADLLEQDPVFQLKGSMLAITVMELAHNDLARLDQQLSEKVAQAPAFFSNTPLVLALDKLPDGEGELEATLVRRRAPDPSVSHAVLMVHGFTDYFFNTELADRFAARGIASMRSTCTNADAPTATGRLHTSPPTWPATTLN